MDEEERDEDQEMLAFTYVRRGRGVLVLAALFGIALFFFPWVHVRIPERITLTGYDMSRVLGWLWATPVAWVTLLAAVLSRRSLVQMRSARVAALFLAAVPFVSVLALILSPPHSRVVPLRFVWAGGLWATMAACVVALPFAALLGVNMREFWGKLASRTRPPGG